MVETNRKVGYEEVKMNILKKVNEIGPMGDIESWKVAFPEVDFFDLVCPNAEAERLFEQGSLEGMVEINWNERTPTERLFYVAYYLSPEDVEIKYDLVIEEEIVLAKKITAPDTIWYMWINGCFSGEDLTEEALRDFVGEGADDLDLDKVQVLNLEAKVAQVW